MTNTETQNKESANNQQAISEILYYDRELKTLCKETVLGDSFIKWAYQTMSGRLLSPILFCSSILSRMLGWYFDSGLSKGKIEGTIDHLAIVKSEFLPPESGETSEAAVIGQYKTFNQFFYRKLKPESRPFSEKIEDFVSPADGRILVYDKLDESTLLPVKGAVDTFNSLFNREISDFDGGKVAVVRLCPADYHRYHFPCAGKIGEVKKVKGGYHSVNPVALEQRPDLFCLNKREYTMIESETFGKVAYMEVGAFGVAGIEQTYKGETVEKMDEKGYFKFGGSTVVLVFQKGKIEFSGDLLEQSAAGHETLVKVGQTIASAVK